MLIGVPTGQTSKQKGQTAVPRQREFSNRFLARASGSEHTTSVLMRWPLRGHADGRAASTDAERSPPIVKQKHRVQ